MNYISILLRIYWIRFYRGTVFNTFGSQCTHISRNLKADQILNAIRDFAIHSTIEEKSYWFHPTGIRLRNLVIA